jgi:hypothetical protein
VKQRSDFGIAIATLIGDEYLAEPESFCDRSGHICFSAIQEPIDLNAINSELPCKVGWLLSRPTAVLSSSITSRSSSIIAGRASSLVSESSRFPLPGR